ncbi:MAG: protein kinase domain-containing protein [Candidatus Eiseniibacteriota bacterium]
MPATGLTPGTMIGPYEVLGPLGKGGMGEVHRAHDSRLGRDVAIKAVPEAFAEDPERLARFERESRLLAALSHPNIATIHGVEVTGRQRHLILEFVEGETLADRLQRGPLPLNEALDVARQMAAALEAAHESGIVHRDLKPGNVMITPSDTVKILDFGLAKGETGNTSTSDIGLSASPTMTYAATELGVILGTAAYMSPEQARGKPVDRRTDIWSFGCVLYECLTGRQLFSGETVSDTVARILEREPDWSALPPKTPVRVRELLRRCLEKDSKKRLRDIGDARVELDEIVSLGASGVALRPGGAAGGRQASSPGLSLAGDWTASTETRGRLSWIPWAVAAAAVVAAVASFVLPGRLGRAPSSGVLRTSILGPPGLNTSTRPADAALSPDGRNLVMCVADSTQAGQLWMRPLDALDARPIPGAGAELVSNSVGLPFWSPDGKSIGYFSDGKLKTIPVTGGTPQVLCDAPDARGGTWGKSGIILFAPTNQGPIFRVSATGGEPVQESVLDSAAGETGHRAPRFLDDGRRYTFTSLPRKENKLDTWLGTLGERKRTKVIAAESGAVFVPPNHLVYVRDRSLIAQRVDPGSLRTKGAPVPIGDAPADLNTLGTSPIASSGNGVLLFPAARVVSARAVWYGRDGREQGVFPIPPAQYTEFVLSPDGGRIAIVRNTTSTSSDVWIADANHGTLTRLTFDGIQRFNLQWSPDGRKLAYTSVRGGGQQLYIRSADGSDDEEVLYESGNPFKSALQWTDDGKYILFQQLDPQTNQDVWLIPLEGDRKPVPYLNSRFAEGAGAVSPDGRWMIYTSTETGRPELYAQSFPTPGNKIRLTRNGAFGAGWRADGREILYGDGVAVYAIAVRSGATLEAGEARFLFKVPDDVAAIGVTPDLQRFLFGLQTEQNRQDAFTLLMNWDALTAQGR